MTTAISAIRVALQIVRGRFNSVWFLWPRVLGLIVACACVVQSDAGVQAQEPTGGQVEDGDIEVLSAEVGRHLSQGQFSEAEKATKKILAVARQMEPQGGPMTVCALFSQGQAHIGLKRYEEALRVVREALPLARKHPGDRGKLLYIAVRDVGDLLVMTKRPKEAAPFLKEAVSLAGVIGNREGELADRHERLGLALYADEQYTEAERQFERATELFPSDQASLSHRLLGDIHFLHKRFNEAGDHYRKAIVILEKKDDKDDLAEALEGLRKVCHAQERTQEANLLGRRVLALSEEILVDYTTLNRHFDRLDPKFDKQLTRLINIREELYGLDDPKVAETLDLWAGRLRNVGRLDKAIPLLERSLEIRRAFYDEHDPCVADSQIRLGDVFVAVGRFADATVQYKKALAIREHFYGQNDVKVADVLRDLAYVLEMQRLLGEAEYCVKRCVTIVTKIHGSSHAKVGGMIRRLGRIQAIQGRTDEGGRNLEKALRILKETAGDISPEVRSLTEELACFYMAEERYDEAESAIGELERIQPSELFSKDDRDASYAGLLSVKANLHVNRKEYGRAENLLRQAIAVLESEKGRDHPKIANCLGGLSVIRAVQDQHDEAIDLINREIRIHEAGGISPGSLSGAYQYRAALQWDSGHRPDAIASLRQAMHLIEQQRWKLAGTESYRSRSFGEFLGVFEKMVDYQATLGDVAEVFSAMERARARSMLELMQTHGLDLLAGIPRQETQGLRKRKQDATTHIASLEKQLQILSARSDLPATARQQRVRELTEELRGARRQLVDVRADVRNASPAYRLAVSRGQRPRDLEEVQAWVSEQEALLLEYFLGEDGGYVLIVRPEGGARIERLVLSNDQSVSLSVGSGPLIDRKLGAVMSNDRGTGVLQKVRGLDWNSAKIIALWELLVPEQERTAIVNGKFQRLIVIADGWLARLPFEALVVTPGKEPQYLLDVSPPIMYAPSATILINLDAREGTRRNGGISSVLTVGDPVYREGEAATDRGLLAGLGSRSRYRGFGGKLSRLPHSAKESKGILEAFDKNGIPVTQLVREQATEANVRKEVDNCSILHFACHGLVDQSHGNLFGALAVTAGRTLGDANNDGFLTLAEIYGLDLAGCELAILSACDTNSGPIQRGEGVWSLSRGFLVAGARRVVATHWAVEDEAASKLVERFCANLAKAHKQGGPMDYAEALREAKLWIRDQRAEWKEPRYWAPFILVGPP